MAYEVDSDQWGVYLTAGTAGWHGTVESETLTPEQARRVAAELVEHARRVEQTWEHDRQLCAERGHAPVSSWWRGYHCRRPGCGATLDTTSP